MPPLANRIHVDIIIVLIVMLLTKGSNASVAPVVHRTFLLLLLLHLKVFPLMMQDCHEGHTGFVNHKAFEALLGSSTANAVGAFDALRKGIYRHDGGALVAELAR